MGLSVSKAGQMNTGKSPSKHTIRESQTKSVKILLLGNSQAGKTTLYRQLRVLYKGGFSDEESRKYCDSVACSIFSLTSDTLKVNEKETMENDLKNVKQKRSNLEIPLLEEDVCPLSPEDHENMLSMKTACFRNARIKNQGLLNRIFSRFSGSEGERLLSGYDKINPQVSNHLQYFITRIPDIVKSEYVPTPTDLLHMRIPTTGLAEMDFQANSTTFQVYDVGGERTERRKWIHYFEDVNLVLFVVDISGYNNITDEGRNTLHESLEVFEGICQDKFLKGAKTVLLFNKCDLFRKKLYVAPLKECFPDYTGNRDVCEANTYISDKFRRIFHTSKKKEIDIYFICATDSHMMKTVFQDIFSQVN